MQIVQDRSEIVSRIRQWGVRVLVHAGAFRNRRRANHHGHRLIGFGGSYLVKAAIEQSKEYSESLIQELNELYMYYYNQEMIKKSYLYKGVIETLDKLIRNNINLAICTNKISKFTLPLLDYLMIRKYFKVIVCGDTYSFKKPSPYPLIQILSIFDLKPKNALYIGDTNIDKMAAESANIQFIYAAYGYGNLDFDQNIKIENINDLLIM